MSSVSADIGGRFGRIRLISAGGVKCIIMTWGGGGGGGVVMMGDGVVVVVVVEGGGGGGVGLFSKRNTGISTSALILKYSSSIYFSMFINYMNI